MAYSTLRLQISGDIATITLSRPEKRNAISTEMIDELMAALAEVETNSARVAILTGEGKAYCSGIDLAAVNGASIAGGCGIATLCDFTLAVPEATFGYPEVRIGFLPANVAVFLMRQINEKHAR